MNNRSLWERRLNLEADLMNKVFPWAKFTMNQNSACFSGWVKGSSESDNFLLQITISENYPDQKPSLNIMYPKILLTYSQSRRINDIGSSHDWHTCNNNGEEVQICHTHTDDWDASMTCVGILTRGIVWVYAYEYHLKTGKTIAAIIDELIKKQEQKITTEPHYATSTLLSNNYNFFPLTELKPKNNCIDDLLPKYRDLFS